MENQKLIKKLENETQEIESRFKMRCCKMSRIKCCKNLVPVWSETDLQRIQENKKQINELKGLHKKSA